jgi:hypothetical protein
MMYQSGKFEERVTRYQLAERLAEMTAIASNIIPHSKPLNGSRKLSQLVEMPGFLM